MSKQLTRIPFNPTVNRHPGFYAGELECIRYDRDRNPGDRYAIRLPDGTWKRLDVTKANQARLAFNKANFKINFAGEEIQIHHPPKVSPKTLRRYIQAPFGTRLDVDPYIIRLPDPEKDGSFQWMAVRPDGSLNWLNGDMDGARAYCHVVYVRNKMPAPKDLDLVKARVLVTIHNLFNEKRAAQQKSDASLGTSRRYLNPGKGYESGPPKLFKECIHEFLLAHV